MANNKTKETSVSTFEKVLFAVDSFFREYWQKVVVVAGVLVIAALVAVVVTTVNTTKFEKSFITLEALQADYESTQAMDVSSADYTSAIVTLEASLQELVASTSAGSYPSLRAEYLLGQIAWDKDDYAAARDYFLSVHNNSKGIYLGAVALLNAASASEELGDDTSALNYYQQVSAVYGEDIAVAPRALFGEGRLTEKGGDVELAKAIFQVLVDEYPNSEYARVARNRLLMF